MDQNEAPSAESAQATLRRQQHLRKRRIGMSTLSYSVSSVVIAFCWYHGIVPWLAVPGFVAATLLINGCFWWLTHTGLNLRFKDPSLILLQLLVGSTVTLIGYALLPGMRCAKTSSTAAVASERSHSGLVQRFAKPPCGVTCIEGSNPSLSAILVSIVRP